MPLLSRFRARLCTLALLALLPLPSIAQAPPPAEPPPPPAPPATLEKVEVIGARPSDTEERRLSTAAKIIVGRDEIERFGDSTVGEILKRLPGVTVQGAPGRGGNIRMRGLGGGYTQILLDGERVPPGFSLDSLTPEQIERIEILRAPTAETGARAIAGTINIITREGFRKRINDLRIGSAFEGGHLSPGFSWTHNNSAGGLTYNLSLSGFKQDRENESVTTTIDQRLDNGATTLDQTEHNLSRERRQGLHLTSRLQWRGEQGDALTLTPFIIYSDGRTHREAQLQQSVGASPALYDHAASDGDGSFTLARVNGQWNKRLADGTRLEVRGGLGQAHSVSQSLRTEFDAADALVRMLDDRADTRERTFTAAGKASKSLGNDHSLVSGIEAEAARRTEARTTLQDGLPLLADFGENLQASSTRFALYAQDEWALSPQWAAHAGLRWEGITTRGDSGNGTTEQNRSSVWTPLAHAVWKPDPNSRDQVRVSLTRSYRSPTLQNLIARPSISTRFPVPGENFPTAPDRAGNPALLPELASGIDVALEHYFAGGGLLSANVFRRNIKNLIRSVTALENVPWANVPRWVSRPQNVGDAITQGLELEAKFRLTEVWAEALPVDLRANLSFFNSRVASVPGPDNRLDQQPKATANLGADYRIRGIPLTLGGNLNWNPAYTTRVSEIQTAYQGKKTVIDAYALWTFSPALQLRVLASNLAAADYATGGSIDTDTVRETSQTTARSYVNWQLRLEMKL